MDSGLKGFKGLGFGVQRFRVWGLGVSGFRVSDFGVGVRGLGFRVWGRLGEKSFWLYAPFLGHCNYPKSYNPKA